MIRVHVHRPQKMAVNEQTGETVELESEGNYTAVIKPDQLEEYRAYIARIEHSITAVEVADEDQKVIDRINALDEIKRLLPNLKKLSDRADDIIKAADKSK